MDNNWLFLQDAMKHGTVKGTFKKFYYHCNAFSQYILCRNKEDFIKLINHWNGQSAKFCHGKFVFTYGSVLGRVEIPEPEEGTLMTLREIVEDQQVKDFSTVGSRTLRCVLWDVGVEYIQ